MTYPVFTSHVDNVSEALHAADINQLQKAVETRIYADRVGTGIDYSGTTNSRETLRVAIEEAQGHVGTDLGAAVVIGAGRVRVDSQLEIPIGVSLLCAGPGATQFAAPVAYSGPIFQVTATSPANYTYDQGHHQRLKGFQICDWSSAYGNVQYNGRSHSARGIEVYGSDSVIIEDVLFRDLKGYGLKLHQIVRESLIKECYWENCGDQAVDEAVFEVYCNAAGEITNEIIVRDSRVVHPTYLALRLDGVAASLDATAFFYWIGGQIEGGGNGSGANFGESWPYDLVALNRVRNATFRDVTMGGAGQGKYLIKATGDATHFIKRLLVDGGYYGDYFTGGVSTGPAGIYLGHVVYADIMTEFGNLPAGKVVISSDVPGVYIDPRTRISSANGDIVGEGGVEAYKANLRGLSSVAQAGRQGARPMIGVYNNGVIGNGATILTKDIECSDFDSAGAITGLILEAGTWDGQPVRVRNRSVNQATFAAFGTSHVYQGAAVVMPFGTILDFSWSSVANLWLSEKP